MSSTISHATAPTASPASSSPVPAATRGEVLGDAIAELAARLHAATYDLLVLLREFDAMGAWSNGFRSCAHWLSWRTGIDLGAARQKVRVARALADLPRVSAAMKRGELSYAKVRAVTRVARPENETRLLDVALAGTAAHVERIVRAWRRVDRIEAARRVDERHLQRQLTTWVDDDGMLVIRGRLTPELGAVVQRALDAASDRLFRESAKAPDSSRAAGEVTAAQRRADALGRIAECALSADLDRGTSGDRYQVVVHVDAPVLQSESDGVPSPAERGQAALEVADTATDVPAETCRRIACDASVVMMRSGADGSVLDVGRKTRTISTALRRALAARDRHCRYPACAARRVDGHHVRHWADGGPTNLANVISLCPAHHRAVHEGGVRVTCEPDGTFAFYGTDGARLEEAPAPPPWRIRDTADPLRPTNARLAAAGVTIGPHTARSHWTGEAIDLVWVIDVVRGEPAAQSRFHK